MRQLLPACLLVVALAMAATADANDRMNYQGVLTDATGAPLPPGDYAMEFKIYDSGPVGTGALVWGPQVFDGVVATGHAPRVTVTDGRFNVVLGPRDTGSRGLASAVTGGPRFLEISVGGNVVTRHEILAAPTAMNGVPPGCVMPFAGALASVPAGWLPCDGRAVVSSQYPMLFAAIGTSWGNGSSDTDPATNFNLPDLRGRFLRGLDGDAGRDPHAEARTASQPGGNTGDNVGSVQEDAYQAHHHWLRRGAASGGPAKYNAAAQVVVGANANSGGFVHDLSAEAMESLEAPNGGGLPRVAGETRPDNASVLYIIKY